MSNPTRARLSDDSKYHPDRAAQIREDFKRVANCICRRVARQAKKQSPEKSIMTSSDRFQEADNLSDAYTLRQLEVQMLGLLSWTRAKMDGAESLASNDISRALDEARFRPLHTLSHAETDESSVTTSKRAELKRLFQSLFENPMEMYDQDRPIFETAEDDLDPYALALMASDPPDLGFELEVKKSSMDGAGMGLFVKGKAPEGTLIAIVPGLVALTEHGDLYSDYLDHAMAHMLTEEPGSADDMDDVTLVARADDVLIDTGVDFTEVDEADESTWPKYYIPEPQNSERGQLRLATKVNPFAVGHRINHANDPAKLNVIQLPFDFPDSYPREVYPYVPTRMLAPVDMPSGKASAVAFSNVYVTLRDVEDEEILADYRLDPTNGYPQWYKPIDEKAAEARWKGVE